MELLPMTRKFRINEEFPWDGDCVHCGYCCRKGVCTYGKWDDARHACIFLTDDDLCGIYDKVKDDKVCPAMGAGCSSQMNSYRRARLSELHNLGQLEIKR